MRGYLRFNREVGLYAEAGMLQTDAPDSLFIQADHDWMQLSDEEMDWYDAHCVREQSDWSDYEYLARIGVWSSGLVDGDPDAD